MSANSWFSRIDSKTSFAKKLTSLLRIVLRAEWDVAQHLQSGKLKQVMKNFKTPDADIYAVYAERHKTSVRVKTLIDFAIETFENK